MGLFDKKWIVEFEYSNGVFSSNKKATMVVDASSEFSAKDRAKAVLKNSYKYVKVLSAHVSSGRDEERNASFKPKVNERPRQAYSAPTQRSEPTSAFSTHRKLSPEEREAILAEIQAREELQRKKAKLNEIENKAKKFKKASKYHIRTTIISAILSLIAFLFGWIPCWINLFMAAVSRTQLQMWVELGHSESDATGQEFSASIEKYTKQANSLIWIPFVILAVGFMITVIVYMVSKGKTPAKKEAAEEDLKKTVKVYEEEYGPLGVKQY